MSSRSRSSLADSIPHRKTIDASKPLNRETVSTTIPCFVRCCSIDQWAGHVGSTCGPAPKPGYDHIYLVLKTLNPDEMVIADNQQQNPHFRFASGQGKTPTKFFLRAPSNKPNS
jgi:hypothetical protein